MTNEHTAMLVLQDAEGRYYLLSRNELEKARATAGQQAAIEQTLGRDDTSGYAVGDLHTDNLIGARRIADLTVLGWVPATNTLAGANTHAVFEFIRP